MHARQSDICSVPTIGLDIDRISYLCHLILKTDSLCLTILWVFVFGSVVRDAYRPDSGIDILVDYPKQPDCVRGSINRLMDNLFEVLDQKADVVPDVEVFEIAYVWKLW